MKIGRKYFEIEEEEVKVGSVGDVGGADDSDANAGGGDAEEDSAEDGSAEEVSTEEVSTEETEEKNEIEPLDDAVVNEVKTTKRGRKAKGAEQ